jgi:hypothetical protein
MLDNNNYQGLVVDLQQNDLQMRCCRARVATVRNRKGKDLKRTGQRCHQGRGSGTRDSDGKHRECTAMVRHGLLNYHQTIQRVNLHQLAEVKHNLYELSKHYAMKTYGVVVV